MNKRHIEVRMLVKFNFSFVFLFYYAIFYSQSIKDFIRGSSVFFWLTVRRNVVIIS